MTDYGREDRREARRWFGLGLLGWVLIILLALLLAAAVWGMRVLTSEVRGQGDAVIQRNSAENWVAAQAKFEGNYAEYEATLVKIEERAALAAADPDDKTLRTEVSGLRSYCASVAADYNADARSFLLEDFRSADLPGRLDADTCNE